MSADSKQTDFGFGVDAQTEDPLRDLTRLAHQASPHDLVMGGISRAGSQQMVNTEIRLIIFFAAKDGEALYSQQKQDRELTVAQIMNSLLPDSDLN